MNEIWIKINKDKSNLPNENGDYFVYVGYGGHRGIHIVSVNLNECYGINFIESHGSHFMKVQFPKIPLNNS